MVKMNRMVAAIAAVAGAIGVAAAIAAAPVASQDEPGRLRFDVVSVKVDHTGTGGAGDRFPRHGTWKWTRIPLSFLVMYAYDVSLKQIANIPNSFQGPDTAFEIIAKMPPDVTDVLMPMLRSEPAVMNLTVLPGVVSHPDGDAVHFDVLHGSANEVIGRLGLPATVGTQFFSKPAGAFGPKYKSTDPSAFFIRSCRDERSVISVLFSIRVRVDTS